MWRKKLLALPADMETVLARDAEVHFIGARSGQVKDAADQQR